MGVFVIGEFGGNLANRSNQFAATVNHRFKTTRKMLAIERAPTQNG